MPKVLDDDAEEILPGGIAGAKAGVTTEYETDEFSEDVDEEGFESKVMPPGKYPLLISDFKTKPVVKENKDTGAMETLINWSVKFTCISENEWKNHSFFHTFHGGIKSKQFKFRFANAAAGIEEGQPIKFKAADVNGKVIDADVKINEYNGTRSNQVSNCYKPSEATLELAKNTNVAG